MSSPPLPWEEAARQSKAILPWEEAQQQQGAAIQPVTRSTNPKLNIAASGENMPEYVGATGAAGAGLMGGAALGETPLVGPALKWAGRKLAPFALPAAGSYLINQARELPVVGPVIKHIPFAEMLPWLVSGKGKEVEEREAVNPGAPYPKATPEQLNPSLVSPSRTLPGMNPPEVISRPTPGPIAGPSRGLALPGQVERPMPEIPPSRVSTTPPKGTPMTKADILARLRANAQRIQAEESVAPEASGPPLRVAGKDVPAGTSLESALQKSIPPNRIQGKIMQVVRREGTLGMDRLMQAPELQGLSRQQIEDAAMSLGKSEKLWVPTKEADAHGPAGIISLAIRKK